MGNCARISEGRKQSARTLRWTVMQMAMEIIYSGRTFQRYATVFASSVTSFDLELLPTAVQKVRKMVWKATV